MAEENLRDVLFLFSYYCSVFRYIPIYVNVQNVPHYEFLPVNSNDSLVLEHVNSLFESVLHTLSTFVCLMKVYTCNVNIFNLSLLNMGFMKYH